MTEFLQFAFSGLTIGAIYALVALGFTLIYTASDIINFAQGEFVMIGGMATAFLYVAGLPLTIAAIASLLVAGTVGFLLYYLTIKPAKDASPATLIIITIGASLLVRGGVQVLLDKQIHRFPAINGDTDITVLGAMLQVQSLWVLCGAILIFAALHVFLRHTVEGQASRATATNKLAASLVGIEISRILALAFVLSAAIGAIAGILVTPITLTRYDIGTLLALKGFAAAMLGGIGNPFGAIVGGLIIGILEALGAGYISSTYKDGFAFIVMLLILMFLPGGLLGLRRVERV